MPFLNFEGDPEAELNRREMVANGTNRTTLKLIQDTLHQVNHYVQQFKYVLETDENINEPGKRVVIKADKHTNRYHKGTLNAPQEMDFAAIVSDEHDEAKSRNIQLHPRGGPLQYIHELHKSYDPLQVSMFYYKHFLKNQQKNHMIYFTFASLLCSIH